MLNNLGHAITQQEWSWHMSWIICGILCNIVKFYEHEYKSLFGEVLY